MADRSKIEWTDATLNPIRARRRDTGETGWHCEHITEACRHCYAEGINRRLGTRLAYRRQDRDEAEHYLDATALRRPLAWRRPRRIFWGSMTDLFGEWVTDGMLDRIFAVMALTPHHTHQVLTKRPDRMRAYLMGLAPNWAMRLAESNPPGTLQVSKADIQRQLGIAGKFDTDPATPTWPLPNVWCGVSVHDQPSADYFVPILLDTPAAVRFASYEPALGPIDWTAIRKYNVKREPWINALRGLVTRGGLPTSPSECGFNISTRIPAELPALDQIIFGGESGPKARPAHPDWARRTRDQCAAAGVAYFHKQWGEWLPGIVHSESIDGVLKGGFVHHQDGSRNTHRGMADHWWQGDSFGGVISTRVGKHRAGRLLDGVEHNGLPPVRR